MRVNPCVTAMFLMALFAGCERKPALRILCGSSMSTPMQEVGQAYRSERGVEIAFDLGGSETLLPKILAGAQADLFVCHDPFEQKLKDAGKWAGSAVVGVMRPVLMVRAGNPKNIRSLDDLARRDVKLGIGDPRYSTCGEMFVAMLEKKGIKEGVMAQVALQGRTHAEIANGAILGPLDAVVVWNFVSMMYQGKLEVVDTGDPYEPVRVTVVGLTASPDPAARDAFLEVCRTPMVTTVFSRHGYNP